MAHETKQELRWKIDKLYEHIGLLEAVIKNMRDVSRLQDERERRFVGDLNDLRKHLNEARDGFGEI